MNKRYLYCWLNGNLMIGDCLPQGAYGVLYATETDLNHALSIAQLSSNGQTRYLQRVSMAKTYLQKQSAITAYRVRVWAKLKSINERTKPCMEIAV